MPFESDIRFVAVSSIGQVDVLAHNWEPTYGQHRKIKKGIGRYIIKDMKTLPNYNRLGIQSIPLTDSKIKLSDFVLFRKKTFPMT